MGVGGRVLSGEGVRRSLIVLGMMLAMALCQMLTSEMARSLERG